MLQIDNVSKTFGENIALKQLDMILEPGKVMGLIGQNGAGKTTTFRLILQFLSPTTGSILWNGHKISLADKKRIGFLPEERGLYQKRTIEDQVVYFAKLHGMNRADALLALDGWMDRLNVVGKRNDKIQSLSKGNAQKVQMIASLISEPELIILDEPFSGLDPVNTNLMMSEIIRLRDDGSTIIFSSHDMNNVEMISDSITMLHHGKMVLQGSVNSIRESYGRTNIYVESPLPVSDFNKINGIVDIVPTPSGYNITVSNPEVGRDLFNLVTKNGYITAFNQQPPTLDQIFRNKVNSND